MSPAEFDLKIFFVFLSVWGVDLQVFLDLVDLEVVHGHSLIRAQGLFHLDVKILGKIISILNSEDSLVEIDVGRDIEILPAVKVHDTNFFRDFLSVNENSLSDS